MNKYFALIVFICTAATIHTSAQKNATKVELKDGQGQSVGSATLSPAKEGGVSVALDLKNLIPGRHAIHFHETAKCEGPAFTSAGAHYNPDHKQHGMQNPQGPHAGDMPNQFVRQDGVLRAHVLNTVVTLMLGEASLFDADGPTLVVHAKPDDYRSQPAGDAGDRIACAVIERGQIGRAHV